MWPQGMVRLQQGCGYKESPLLCLTFIVLARSAMYSSVIGCHCVETKGEQGLGWSLRMRQGTGTGHLSWGTVISPPLRQFLYEAGQQLSR